MGNIIYNYFQVLTSPFKYQRELRERSQNLHKDSEAVGINYPEAFLLSWPFIMMNVIYSFFSIELSRYLSSYMQVQFPSIPFELVKINTWIGSWQIYFSILGVVFFPLFCLAYIYICRNVIDFCLELFGKNENNLEAIDQVVASSFSSNVFLAFPVFGEVLRFFYTLLILFGGLRCNIGLSRKQSSFVLFFPFIIIMAFSFLIYAFVMLVIWTFFL